MHIHARNGSGHEAIETERHVAEISHRLSVILDDVEIGIDFFIDSLALQSPNVAIVSRMPLKKHFRHVGRISEAVPSVSPSATQTHIKPSIT